MAWLGFRGRAGAVAGPTALARVGARCGDDLHRRLPDRPQRRGLERHRRRLRGRHRRAANRRPRARCPTATCPCTRARSAGRPDSNGNVRDRMQTNGRCESANDRGDTYGPITYIAYVPGYLAYGWSGKWDELPAAHFTRAPVRQPDADRARARRLALRAGSARGDAAVCLGRVPVHAVRVELERERRPPAVPARLRLLARRRRAPARGLFVGLASWAKFASLLLVPALGLVSGRLCSARARSCSSRPGFLRSPLRSPSGCSCSSRIRSTPRASSGTGRSTSSSAATRRSRSGTGPSTRATRTCRVPQTALKVVLLVARGRAAASSPPQDAAPARRAHGLPAHRLRDRADATGSTSTSPGSCRSSPSRCSRPAAQPAREPVEEPRLSDHESGRLGSDAQPGSSARRRARRRPRPRPALRSSRGRCSTWPARAHPDHRHAHVPALRRRDRRRARSRTATSRSSTRPARCRCSSSRRSPPSDDYRTVFEALMALCGRRRSCVARRGRSSRSGRGPRASRRRGFARARAARARAGDPHALRPLAGHAHRRARWPRSCRGVTGSASACSAWRSRRSSTRSCCCRIALLYVARRSGGPGDGVCSGGLRCRARGGLRPVRRRSRRTGSGELRAPDRPSAPDREPRLGSRCSRRSSSAATSRRSSPASARRTSTGALPDALAHRC